MTRPLPPSLLVLLLVALLATVARPSAAQRVVPSVPWTPAGDAGPPVRLQLRSTAGLPADVRCVAEVIGRELPIVAIGWRADSLVVRPVLGLPSSCRAVAPDSMWVNGARRADTLAIAVVDIEHVAVRRYRRARAARQSGGEGAFWGALLGAVAGAAIASDGRGRGALLGAGVGALVGFVGGAAQPDPNHGFEWERVTLRVER